VPSSRARPLLRFALLALLVSTSATARADDYQATVDEAVREYAAGNFVEARSLFEHAHALRPSARTLRALGFCAYELKRYVQAVSELDAATEDTRNPLTEEQQRETAATRAKAERYVAELHLEVEPRDARVVLDGRLLEGRHVRVDAGDHVLAGSAPGHRSRDLTLRLVGGQRQDVQLVLPAIDLEVSADANTGAVAAPLAPTQPAEEPKPSVVERWWFWAAIGGVVAAGAVGTWLIVDGSEGAVDTGSTGVTLHALHGGPLRGR
jgi:hypothetical protein